MKGRTFNQLCDTFGCKEEERDWMERVLSRWGRGRHFKCCQVRASNRRSLKVEKRGDEQQRAPWLGAHGKVRVDGIRNGVGGSPLDRPLPPKWEGEAPISRQVRVAPWGGSVFSAKYETELSVNVKQPLPSGSLGSCGVNSVSPYLWSVLNFRTHLPFQKQLIGFFLYQVICAIQKM